ncbi:MAG TPA: thioredoxin family protein, partial [Alphaproteobacteria bacterium]|nr:thioredoxin family protein [Alphaproteobacteria bacterium]
GIIASFLVIAGILIALQGAGSSVGWGFQLQNPAVITMLIYLLFVIGLNLMGFFEVSARFANFGGRLTGSEGVGGSFFTGVLATIVATPCTAPFMGAAIGFALTQNAAVSLLVFAFLGLGLALPYLALSFIPALQKFLPKPGAWMETFRQLLAFPMFLTCAWLLWVLDQQVGEMGILGAALGLTALSFAIWLSKVLPKKGVRRKVLIALAVFSALLAFGLLPVKPLGGTSVSLQGQVGAFGETYSAAALDEALASPAPVFVEMTAAWCITCKVNHATSLNIESTKKLFTDKGVKFLVGDWTNYDPAITEYLNRFGRNGVPIYVYYGPPNAEGTRPEPKLLPQILTPGIVADAIKV